MERSVRVQALVLSHNDFGEADRYIKLLTPDRGKISALAKGVRKMNSRKAGHLEPFTIISAQLVQGKGSSWIISQVSTIESFPGLTDNLESTCHAAYVSELTDRFATEEYSNFELYKLAVETMRRLSKITDHFPVLRYFDFRLLDLAGFRPQLHSCVRCGNEIIEEQQFFSNILGGVVCPKCGMKESGIVSISSRSLKYFRYYQTHNFSQAAAAGWPADLRQESEIILTNYLTYFAEKKINSQIFLNCIR